MTKIWDFNSEKCSKTVNQCRNFCCVLAKIFSTQHTTQKTRKSCVYTHPYMKNRNPANDMMIQLYPTGLSKFVGLFCLGILMWASRCGPRCGHLDLFIQIRASRSGHLDLRISIWASRSGHLDLGISIQASRSANLDLGISIWASRSRHLDLGISIRASLSGHLDPVISIWASRSGHLEQNLENVTC